MAKQKQHPAIGKYLALYEHDETELASAPPLSDTPEAALQQRIADNDADDGDVYYVYAVVGVKVVRKPTLTENLPA